MKPAPPSGWRAIRGGRALTKNFVLRDFVATVEFVRRIAARAEKLDHHPDLHLTRYRRLRIVLTSHDAGRATSRDLKLAAAIDALATKASRRSR